MIRWSKSTVKSQSAKVQTDFSPVLGSFEDLVCSIFDHPWSPCVWRGGRRAQAGFQSADVIALDFDGGVGLVDVCRVCVSRGLAFAVATTKSHRKAKTKDGLVISPACDRFRLVMPAARTITDVGEYRWAMESAMKDFPGCDRACKDAARFFFPSVRLVGWTEGKSYEWPTYVPPPPMEVKVSDKSKPGSLSVKTRRDLVTVFPMGCRHKELRRLCVILGAQGIPRESAWKMISDNPTGLDEKEKFRLFKGAYEWGYLYGTKR